MSFLETLTNAFNKNKPPLLTPLENAVVETQLAAALYDERTKTFHVLDQSKESKQFMKELRSILEVPIMSRVSLGRSVLPLYSGRIPSGCRSRCESLFSLIG